MIHFGAVDSEVAEVSALSSNVRLSMRIDPNCGIHSSISFVSDPRFSNWNDVSFTVSTDPANLPFTTRSILLRSSTESQLPVIVVEFVRNTSRIPVGMTALSTRFIS